MTTVRLKQIAQYAFINEPSALVVQRVSGYVLVSNKAVVGGVEGVANFFTLLNSQRLPGVTVTFSTSNLSLGDPQLSTDNGRNTKLQATVTSPTIGYGGSAWFYFDRNPIAMAYLDTTLKFAISAATTIYGLLAQINTSYSTALTQRDLVDGPVPANAAGIRLVAADTSLLFTPGTSVTLGTLVPSLASVVTTTNLAGFDKAS